MSLNNQPYPGTAGGQTIKRHRLARFKTRKAKIIYTVLACLVLFGIPVFRLDLDVRHFAVDTDKLTPGSTITFVQLSDFHANNYGRRQHRLIKAIESMSPDAVLLTGDILDHLIPMNNAIELVEELASRWPVFYVFGNHEFMSGDDEVFQTILENNDVTVLRGAVAEFHAHGNTIQIGGIDDLDVSFYRPDHERYWQQLARLGELTNPDMYSIILSHRPERIHEFLDFQPNLVLSGHAHGGQWQFPGLLENGLFAPNQGFFPRYTNGLYEFGNTQLIVSRGLSRYSPPVPRIFNRPDIIVITVSNPA